jgi:hypothetical protein
MWTSASVGVGLRAPHYRAALESPQAVDWFEVHAENYFGGGGPHWCALERIRRDTPISVHGVGLSLGSAEPLSRDHLGKLRAVVERLDPVLVSEHLSWSSVDGRHFNQLLPLPYTAEALKHVSQRIQIVQEELQRRILVENVSRYLEYEDSPIPEPDFLAEVARRTGCGLLVDVSNLYVSATNLGWVAEEYVDSIPPRAIGEVHLAGFGLRRVGGLDVLLDTHDRPVAEEVWRLYERLVRRIGPVPTLVEWDADLPEFGVLVAQAREARSLQQEALRGIPA